jgi:L-ribulokinase
MARILLGLAFGAQDVKAVAIDINTGIMVGHVTEAYQIGVITGKLPNCTKIPSTFVLADPASWIMSMSKVVNRLMDETGIPASEIISLGVSMDSCVVLPTDSLGIPLCMKENLAGKPHAWPKYTTHLGAISQAERLTEIARDRGEPFLEHTGNRVSSEWLWPRLLEIIEDSPDVAAETEWFIEGSDWIVWQLTGRQIRNRCSAGYKGCYVEDVGYPSGSFFESISFDFASIAEKIKIIEVIPPGRKVGGLIPDASKKLGLKPGLPVGAGVISSHVGVAGCGVYEPDVLTLIFGDSTAQMIMSDEEKIFEGYSCCVRDGIIDGFWGFEAGQPGTGSTFKWFTDILAPSELTQRAHQADVDKKVILDRWLSEVKPGSGGLLSLDWFDGNKSVLFNPYLRGIMSGLNLKTTPSEIYKSIVEATAFGTRRIIDAFEDGGLRIKKIVATGTLPFESPTALQIYSDITGYTIEVPDTPEAVARGTAIIGAMSVDMSKLGYKNREEYFEAMKPPKHDLFEPNQTNADVYMPIYDRYKEMYDTFGH